jgi:hypothetical protein
VRSAEYGLIFLQAPAWLCCNIFHGVFEAVLGGVYHFTEHFAEVAKGSRAEKAQLDIEVLTDLKESYAQDIMLDSVEVED